METQSTKDRLLDSFFELSQNKPVDKITVKQISANCGLTSQTFYNHFKDKYDLISWAFKRRIDVLYLDYVDGKITWRGFIESALVGYKKNSKTILNVFENTHGDDSYIRESAKYLIEKMMSDLKERLRTDEVDIETELLIRTYMSGVMNIIGFWLMRRNDLDEKVVAKAIDDAMPKALRDLYSR